MFNFSENYIGQYFKKIMKINIQNYIEYIRMENIIKLILNTKKKIKKIINCIDFKSISYFCKRFKIIFGISIFQIRKI